jgi:predicted lactoylglutathione lyase
MYVWGFEDLDGHIWEHAWMDPAAVQGEAAATA